MLSSVHVIVCKPQVSLKSWHQVPHHVPSQDRQAKTCDLQNKVPPMKICIRVSEKVKAVMTLKLWTLAVLQADGPTCQLVQGIKRLDREAPSCLTLMKSSLCRFTAQVQVVLFSNDDLTLIAFTDWMQDYLFVSTTTGRTHNPNNLNQNTI